MKRLIFIVFAFALFSCEEQRTISDIPQVEVPESYNYEATGTVDSYDYIDLGLSVKWATKNVGAESPEQAGIYVAWGEVEQKSEYSWSTYKYCNGSDNTLTKYCTESSCGYNGFTDDKVDLDPSDDAARHNCGDRWRMPTDLEVAELRSECQWTWCRYSGVEGYQVTGPNGKSIFIPAVGYCVGKKVSMYGSNGCFWTSNISTFTPSHGYELTIFPGSMIRGSVDRLYGETIRAVLVED